MTLGPTSGYDKQTDYRTPRPALRKKTIITGDWQPRIAYPGEFAALKAVMDDMAAYHSDAEEMIHVGDIVERATQTNTGNFEAVVNYREVLKELAARTKFAQTYFIAGNHDSDGFGLTQHEYAWSQKAYFDYIGRNLYTVRTGNLLRVFMGTDTGDPGGNIHATSLDWFDRVLKRNKGVNIEVYLHQPIYGAGGFTENTQWVQYKATSDRIKASLAACDNIAFVGFGHVLRPEGSPNFWTIDGKKHICFNMHIPRISSDPDGQGAGSELPYGVLEYARGATAATIKMWNAATHAYIAGRDVSVTYKYPLDLGDGHPDHDGRHQLQPFSPHVEGTMQIRRDLWEMRYNAGTSGSPNWQNVAGFRPGLNMILSSAAPSGENAGDGLSIDWWLPASVTSPDADGSSKNDISGNYLGGRVGVRRENGTDADPSGEFAVQLSTDGATLFDALTVRASDGKAFAPLSRIGAALPDLGLLAGLGLDNSLMAKGAIGSGGNFDTTGEPGIYHVLSGAEAATITGIPFTGSGGVLIVLNPSTPGTSRPVAIVNQMQIYFARAVGDGGRIYFRVCNGGTWVGWMRITAAAA